MVAYLVPRHYYFKYLCFHATTASKINYLSYGLQNNF